MEMRKKQQERDDEQEGKKKQRMITIRRLEEIDKCRDETVSGGAAVVTEPSGSNSSSKKEDHSCWNFPRVKLRRLFNAKSLDDILGRSSTGSGSRGKATPLGSSGNIAQKNALSHSNLTVLTKPAPLNTTKSETNCHVVAGTPSESTGSSTSFFTKHRKAPIATHVALQSGTKVRVKGAKSDNCLHRIVSSSPCSKVGSNSVDNLDNDEPRKTPKTPEEPVVAVPVKSAVILPKISSPEVPATAAETEEEKMTKEKAKLVVANVSYLQRPLSPTPASLLQQFSGGNNNVFRVPATSPPNTGGSGGSGNRNNFYSPPGTNQTCANSSNYSYHNYNKIQLDRPSRHCSPAGRLDNAERVQNNNRGFSPLRPTNIIEGMSDGIDNNRGRMMMVTKQRLRPESPELCNSNNRISRAKMNNICDSNSSGLTGGSSNNRIIGSRGKSVDSTIRQRVGSPQDYPSGEGGEGMGDLQSPQYVKRTAHMFDSRYTAQVNGSESRTDQPHQERLSSQQPSYLNVSRSVCGYSCLSYNNGTTTTAMTTTNGVTSSSSSTTKSSKRISTDFTSPYRHTTTNGVHTMSNNNNNPARRDPVMKTISSALDVENSQNLEQHHQGLTTRKSNILEKIERLYGTNAVTTTSLWRRPVPSSQLTQQIPPTASTTASPYKQSTLNGTSTATAAGGSTARSSEKIIPILLEQGARSQLKQDVSSNNGSSDDYNQHTRRAYHQSPSFRRISSTAQQDNRNVGDNDIHHDADEANDDLYSKHKLVHSNRVNGHHSNQLQQQQHKEETQQSIQSAKSTSPSSPPPRSLVVDDPSRPQITSRIIRESASPSAKPATTEPNFVQENNMVKDGLFPVIEPESAQLYSQKTEDSPDGEAKPVFRIVSNLKQQSQEEQLEKKPKEVEITEVVKENVASGAAVAVEKNGEYFLKVMSDEKNHIVGLIKAAESRLESLNTSEEGSADVELSGQILAAIGKAKLLINKKFKQFEGLCHDNIEQRKKGVGESEPFTTKNEDLEGFWDMVLIQVDQIHSMLQNLDGNKESAKNVRSTSDSSFETPKKPESSSASSKRTPAQRLPGATPKSSAVNKTKSAGNTARDESRRKMLAERRKAMKDQLEAQAAAAAAAGQSPDVQIFVPTSSDT